MAAASEIKSYLSKKDPKLQKVASDVRRQVKKIVPGVTETVNAWGIPTFETQAPFAYMMVGKNHVTLGFHCGTSLEDPHGLLQGTGKNLRHVKLRTREDFSRAGIRELIATAAHHRPTGKKSPMRGKR
jgi:hypothetical protein